MVAGSGGAVLSESGLTEQVVMFTERFDGKETLSLDFHPVRQSSLKNITECSC